MLRAAGRDNQGLMVFKLWDWDGTLQQAEKTITVQ
jgi:hypothetical protein